MANWSDFLAALGGFGAGASQSIGQRGREREEMEFREGQQERLFGQQERLQMRGFQHAEALEGRRAQERAATAALAGTTPTVSLADVFRREFRIPPSASELMEHAPEPGTAVVPRPPVREPERVPTSQLGPLGTIIAQRETRTAKPAGYPIEDLTKMFQGGGQGGLEMETKVPIAGGGEATFKRPRQEKRELSYEQQIAAGLTGVNPKKPIETYTPEDFENVRKGLGMLRATTTDAATGARLDALASRLDQIGKVAGAKTEGRIETEHALRQKMAETAATRASAVHTANLDAELAQGKGGVPRITERAIAVEAGKPVLAETQNRLKTYVSALGIADRIRKEFSPEQIEKWVGLGTAAGAHGGNFQAFYEALKGDPEFTRFKVLDNQMATFVFDLGGKQLTPFEASVVFAAYPTLRGKLTGRYYLTTLDEFEDRTRREITTLSGLATTPKGQLGETLQRITPPASSPGPGQVAPGAKNPARPPAPVGVPVSVGGVWLPNPQGLREGKTAGGGKYIIRGGQWQPVQP